MRFTLSFYLGLAGLIMSHLSSAQEKVNDYTMSYFEVPSYDISATEEKGEISYYVSMYSMEGKSSPVILMIDGDSELDDFVADLQTAANTYAKWDSVSVANSVTDLNKEMSVSTRGLKTAFLYGSSWNFDYSSPLSYTFKHLDEVPNLLIRTGELQSVSNEYIDSDGGIFVFSSIEEINEFIRALDPKYARDHFMEKASKDNLFDD